MTISMIFVKFSIVSATRMMGGAEGAMATAPGTTTLLGSDSFFLLFRPDLLFKTSTAAYQIWL
jgi:hypothetical protein